MMKNEIEKMVEELSVLLNTLYECTWSKKQDFAPLLRHFLMRENVPERIIIGAFEACLHDGVEQITPYELKKRIFCLNYTPADAVWAKLLRFRFNNISDIVPEIALHSFEVSEILIEKGDIQGARVSFRENYKSMVENEIVVNQRRVPVWTVLRGSKESYLEALEEGLKIGCLKREWVEKMRKEITLSSSPDKEEDKPVNQENLEKLKTLFSQKIYKNA